MSEENKENPELFDKNTGDNSEQLQPYSDYINEDENESVEDAQQKKYVSIPVFVCSCIAVCVLAIILTFTVCNNAYKDKIANFNNVTQGTPLDTGKYKEIAILNEIFKVYTFEDLDEEQIKTQLLKAYVYATGDKYAEFYTIEEYIDMVNSSMLGNSVGIGVKVVEGIISVGGAEYKIMKIVDVVKDSPAQKAGVLAGDCVVAIGTVENNTTLNVLGYDAALTKMRGEKGTVAEFAVYRPNGTDYELKFFSITRDEYVDYAVSYKVADADVDPTGKTGIIKINSFNHTTPDEFDVAVSSLKAAGCDKFVFDLRDNPGGELSSIVAVLSRFLNEGDLLITKKDNDGYTTSIKVGVVADDINSEVDCPVSKADIGKYKDLNCVVLCNEFTASAAELFVANFRDYNIAKVIGTTTYGKGTVQSYMSLE